jgi:Na+-translocating ferredoxin:NAD+ oxidoreductase subunit G
MADHHSDSRNNPDPDRRQESRFAGFKRSMLYPTFLLGLFATVSAGLLVSGNILTKDAIAEREREDLQALLAEVIPGELYDNNLLESTVAFTHSNGEQATAYRATREGEPVAVAFPISGMGYSGLISMLVGIDHNGKILGVRVISHTETPGLGDKIEARRSDWIFGFDGLPKDSSDNTSLKIKGDGGTFDQLTGATITSRTVVSTVRDGLMFFDKTSDVLLGHTVRDNATFHADIDHEE